MWNHNANGFTRRGPGFLTVSLLALSLILAGQVSGLLVGKLLAQERNEKAREESADRFDDLSNLFAEVYMDIKDKYVEEVEDEELFENALQGMFAALDPHSQYLTPDNFSQLEKETEGEFSGIGIHIALYPKDPEQPASRRNQALTVVAPIPGSPAAEVGLLPWDRIVEIEGESTDGIELSDAVRKLTGPEGSKVNITVARQGVEEPLHFTITRKQIKIESVHSELLDDGILLVRIARFSDNTTEDLKKIIADARAEGARGIIVDLRWDTGGLLSEAISVSDLFLDKGALIVSTKGRLRNQNREYRADSHAMVDWPMLILVNQGTASASEIFAGAMRDHGQALLIAPEGERTYGKGSVQTIDPLEFSIERDVDGNYKPNAIRLTTARYYTPSGTAIDNPDDPEMSGLAPDLEVEVSARHELELSRRGMLLGDVNMVDPRREEDHEGPRRLDPDTEEGREMIELIRELTGREDAVATLTVSGAEAEDTLVFTVGGDLDDDPDAIVDTMLDFAIREMRRFLREGIDIEEARIASAEEAETETAAR